MSMLRAIQNNFVIVTFLGKQPSATAVKLATLKELGCSPQQVLCAINKDTGSCFEQLKAWGKAQKLGYELVSCDDQKDIFRETDAFIAKDLKTLFDADTGYAKNISRFVNQYADNSNVLYVNSERSSLLLSDHQGNMEPHDLGHLGLDSFLSLYNSKLDNTLTGQNLTSSQSYIKSIIEDFLPDDSYRIPFKLTGSDEIYDFGCEYHGRLYLMSLLNDYKIEKIRNQLSEHNIQGIMTQIALGINELFCSKKSEQEVGEKKIKDLEIACGSTGHASFISKPKDLQKWLPKYQEAASKEKKEENKTQSPQRRELIVGLGTHVSPTLSAISTHEPQLTWVIFDENNFGVFEQLKKLMLISTYLKGHQFRFVPTSFTADKVGSHLYELFKHRSETEFIFETGPGSKIMTRQITFAFTRLKQHFKDGSADKNVSLKLNNINYEDVESKSELLASFPDDHNITHSYVSVLPKYLVYLFNPFNKSFLPLPEKKPNIHLLKDIETRWDFLTCLKNKFVNECGSNTQDFDLNNIKIKRRGPNYTIRSSRNEYFFPVKPLTINDGPGTWFEFVVAYLWANYLENKECDLNIWWGVKTVRPDGSDKAEIDIVAEINGRFFCCSLKSTNYNIEGKSDDLQRHFDIQFLNALKEIRTETRSGFGYTAIPVVIVPYLTDASREHLNTLSGNVNIWTLMDLNNQKTFEQKIKDAISQK